MKWRFNLTPLGKRIFTGSLLIGLLGGVLFLIFSYELFDIRRTIEINVMGVRDHSSSNFESLHDENLLIIRDVEEGLAMGLILWIAMSIVGIYITIVSTKAANDLEGTRSNLNSLNSRLEELVDIRTKDLAETKGLLENIAQGITESVLLLNRDRRILWANKAALDQIGMSFQEIQGKKCYEVTHDSSSPCEPPYDACPIDGFDEDGEVKKMDHIHFDPNGEELYVEVSAYPIKDEKGRVYQFVHLARDITEQKKSMERLKKANEELKKADLLKMKFLNITSHELKTPITPMSAQLQMLLSGTFGEFNDTQRKSLDIILRNTKRLDRLISDILDVSRLESGNLKLHFDTVELESVVSETLETLRPKAEGKGITLSKEVTPIHVQGDYDRIMQVLLNLVNNSIKFTPEKGEIKVSLSKMDGEAYMRVKDNGIGISDADKKRVFLPFEQVDSGLNRQYNGSGLGLAISKGIVERMGGSIALESKVGKGSTFTVILPVKMQGGD